MSSSNTEGWWLKPWLRPVTGFINQGSSRAGSRELQKSSFAMGPDVRTGLVSVVSAAGGGEGREELGGGGEVFVLLDGCVVRTGNVGW